MDTHAQQKTNCNITLVNVMYNYIFQIIENQSEMDIWEVSEKMQKHDQDLNLGLASESRIRYLLVISPRRRKCAQFGWYRIHLRPILDT